MSQFSTVKKSIPSSTIWTVIDIGREGNRLSSIFENFPALVNEPLCEMVLPVPYLPSVATGVISVMYLGPGGYRRRGISFSKVGTDEVRFDVVEVKSRVGDWSCLKHDNWKRLFTLATVIGLDPELSERARELAQELEEIIDGLIAKARRVHFSPYHVMEHGGKVLTEEYSEEYELRIDLETCDLLRRLRQLMVEVQKLYERALAKSGILETVL